MSAALVYGEEQAAESILRCEYRAAEAHTLHDDWTIRFKQRTMRIR